MKKCEYCAKEISYHQQYCDEECQRKALDFYSLREKFTAVFSVINLICIFAIPIGLVVFSFARRIGFSMVAFAVAILGVTVTLLPFPTENMLKDMKIKRAVQVTRIVGIVLLAVGIGLVISDGVIFLFKN